MCNVHFSPARGEQIVPMTPSYWQLVSETRYVYDGKRVIQERNGSNTPTVSYTRGTDLSGSLEGAGGIGGLLARSSGYSGGNWTSHAYYHADGNGNITYLVNSNQTSAAIYRYDPFGNLISKSGTLADANVYRFSSKELHVNSGLYYYLYRFYSPNWQRWINRDPIGEWSGWNLYGFSQQNPVTLVDPFGLAHGNPVPPIVIRPTPFPKPPAPPTPIQWPPTEPFSRHHASATKDKGIQNTSGNAPVACPADLSPSERCNAPGAIKDLDRDGTETKDCPGWGKITVPCFKYKECKPCYQASLSSVVQKGHSWQQQRSCDCPAPPAQTP